MPTPATSQGRDIVFNLKLMSDPSNSDTAKKFGGGVIPPGKSGTTPGGGGRGASEDAKRRAAEEKEEERIHKRHRDRQLERATRHRQTRESETKEAAKQLAAQDREEERIHSRHRQRQLERARASRAETNELVAQARAQAEASRNAASADRARHASATRSRGMAGRSWAMGTRRAGMELGEGITSFVGGAAALGLVGEESQQKVQDTALMVGGGIAVARGTSKIGQGLAGGASAMGISAGAGGLALGAAAVAAIASVTLALAELGEIASGTAGEVGSVTATVGMFLEKNSRSGTGVYTSAYESEQQTKWMEEKRKRVGAVDFDNEGRTLEANRASRMQSFERGYKIDVGDERYRRGFDSIDTKYKQPGLWATKDQMSGLGFANDLAASRAATGNAMSRIAADRGILGQDRALVRGRLAEATNRVNTAVTPEAKDDGQRMLIQVQKEIVGLAERERDLSRQTADTKIAGARDALRINTDILNTARMAQKEARDQMQTAEQRFGNLDEADQSRALRSGAKVKEAMGKIRGGKKDEGMAMLMNVPKADRDLVDSFGLGESSKGVRLAAINEARTKGFGEVYGGDERKRFDRNADIATKVEATLKDKREYIVKVESDEDEIVRQLSNQLKVELDRRDKRIDNEFKRVAAAQNAEAKRVALAEKRAIP